LLRSTDTDLHGVGKLAIHPQVNVNHAAPSQAARQPQIRLIKAHEARRGAGK